MSRVTVRTAETMLTVRGHADLHYPGSESHDDGDGEVEIRVSKRHRGLRLTVSIVTPIPDLNDDAHTEIIADLDPDDFRELLGFERTIRAMTDELSRDGVIVLTPDQRVCAIERMHADAVELGMEDRPDAQARWDGILRST